MKAKLVFSALLLASLLACNLKSVPSPTGTEPPADPPNPPVETLTPLAPTATLTASTTPTIPFTETSAPTETPTATPSNTPIPTVESLRASVTAKLLSCRYGPGPEYLYLFAFRAGANIKLIGRVDASNWDWVLVENERPCWVKASFLEVQGDIQTLPVVYPGIAKLPITPYWPQTQVLNATRDSQTNKITVSWVEVPVSVGHWEDENMQIYIIELWRCQAGELIFDPLGTRLPYITFLDEPGCSQPSHGRVWVQDKHGYAGPAEIPWPAYPVP